MRISDWISDVYSSDLEDFLACGQRTEHLEALEGAGYALAGPRVGLGAGEVLAVEQHGTADRLLQTGDDVEQRRLASTVGTDQARDVPGGHVEVDVADRLVAAEAHVGATHLQESHVRVLRPRPADPLCSPSPRAGGRSGLGRSEEHPSELPSLMPR